MRMNRKIPAAMFFLVFSLFLLSGADRFSFSADRTEAVLSQGKERTVLTGSARVETGKTVINADKIELYGDDFRFVVCTGSIVVRDEEQGFILYSRNLFFDRERELTRVQGYTEMLDQKHSMVVKGSYLENLGDENISIIQIGVRILKEDEDGSTMVCRAEYALYNRDTDLLELSGMPRVTWKGDEYAASRISINLETDEITMEGKVSGTIYSETEE